MTINIDDFKKVEMKIGKIIFAEKVENADKLLKLSVDFGLVEAGIGLGDKKDIRQIIPGIAAHFPDPKILVGKLCPFVTNLEPRTIRGLESNGMILAVSGGSSFSLLEVDPNLYPGSKVG